MQRRLALLLSAMAVALMPATALGAAPAYPTKPVRMVVPFPPGGTTDIVARLVAQKLSEMWDKQVVIDNRGGAGGVIGSETVAKATADGYTMLFGLQTTHAVNPAVYKKLPFDPIKDFVPVTIVAYSPQLLAVHPTVPANSLAEFVALAKSKSGQMNFGSSGIGTSPHLAFELFKRAAGIELTHIPYKGTGPAIAELLGGHVNALIGGVAALTPHIKTGKLRALALANTTRSATLPQVPTMSETGVAGLQGFNVSPWFGLFYPAGTPRPIVEKLFVDARKALQSPDLQTRIADQGAEAVISESPKQFAEYVAREKELWGKIVREVMP